MKINPNILRKKVIDMVVAKQSGHIGGAFSIIELTSVLYEDYDIGGKDKLILSKGHISSNYLCYMKLVRYQMKT